MVIGKFYGSKIVFLIILREVGGFHSPTRSGIDPSTLFVCNGDVENTENLESNHQKRTKHMLVVPEGYITTKE